MWIAAFAQAANKPPWPNGQGVGLLIRRLRVRVPQGVRHSIAAAPSSGASLSGRHLLPRLCASSPSKLSATARGFEPLRAEPNGFLVHHLSHSVTLS